MGQILDAFIPLVQQVEQFQRLKSTNEYILEVLHWAEQLETARLCTMEGQECIFEDREFPEKTDDLKCAGLTEMCPPMCGKKGHVLVKKIDSTSCGWKLTIDEIEEGGLPSTIRSNNSQSLPPPDGERNIVYRLHPTKMLGQLFNP